MRITIETVPHDKQRYETCGDWYYDADNVLHIKVSSMGDMFKEYLIAAHELDEAMLCLKHGVTDKDVDAFDTLFELERENGLHPKDAEAGDDHRAPYRKEHFAATNLERLRADYLGVDWNEYEKAVNALYNSKNGIANKENISWL